MTFWIKHTGDECPVPLNTKVHTHSLFKDIYRTSRAEEIRWRDVDEYRIEDPEGVWIKHNRGPCPVPLETKVIPRVGLYTCDESYRADLPYWGRINAYQIVQNPHQIKIEGDHHHESLD